MTPDQVLGFFNNFGIQPETKYKQVDVKRVVFIVKLAKNWYNTEFAQFVLECFKPTFYAPDGSPIKFSVDVPTKEWFENIRRGK
jgi:hypothetical protein